MPRDRRPYLVLPLVAFVAILPLILKGCSCGHDFDFHLISWMEAARQFTHGNLHPHWAFTPAYNAGEPRFIFYPPLSWTIGALLGLLMPWTWTPIAYTWLALTAAGLTLNHLARTFATPTAALFASTFYIVNPYMLFTAYERTAYAELLAAAWIPLLLHAILRDRVTIPRIAIPVALLWITNAPAAVMSCYALALLTLLRLITTSGTATKLGAPCPDSRTWVSRHRATHLQPALATAAGTLLGLGFAAFYLLPAAYERRYVQIAMALLPGSRIEDNFLFHRTVQPSDPFHDTVLHTASVIAITLIVLTLIVLTLIALTVIARTIAARRAGNPRAPSLPPIEPSAKPAIALAILTLTIAFLLTPPSEPIWNHLPELPFLQFPWRLLAILAPVFALALAIALSPLKLKSTAQRFSAGILALALTATLIASAYSAFHQECDEPDTVPARLTLFQSNAGTEPTDEYTPVTADNDALAQNNPAYWTSGNPLAPAPPNSAPAPAPAHLSLNLETPQSLILNLRNYPAWSITRNRAVLTQRQQRPDGLIAIPLPAGPSEISIRYITPPDQILGNALTALSLILLVITLRRRRASL